MFPHSPPGPDTVVWRDPSPLQPWWEGIVFGVAQEPPPRGQANLDRTSGRVSSDIEKS
jgi:hypothetical protein